MSGGSYTIGKERLFLEVARQLRLKARSPRINSHRKIQKFP